MPTGKNWINFIYINLGFMAYIIAMYYLTSIQEIKANWPLYRCNPMYMPLSDNIEKDFTYCIQNIQGNFMGYLLQPLTFITSSLTGILGNFVGEINTVREMFNKIRTLTSDVIQNVFGVFLNLIIEFQKIIIGIRDLMGKTIGILVTLLYVMDGSIKTMNSTWNGPTGQLVRTLGKCFDPDTQIELKNGEIVYMKDINLGDILKNGSIVISTMKIDNKNNSVPFYLIENAGVNGVDIKVTGSHLIFDKINKKFVKVEEYSRAKKTETKAEWFSCLITSDNKIVIGSEIFWDWEDHFAI